MSEYVKLMEAYKMALRAGKNDKAEALFDKATKLVESGEVSDDELTAGAYI